MLPAATSAPTAAGGAGRARLELAPGEGAVVPNQGRVIGPPARGLSEERGEVGRTIGGHEV